MGIVLLPDQQPASSLEKLGLAPRQSPAGLRYLGQQPKGQRVPVEFVQAAILQLVEDFTGICRRCPEF